MLCIVFSAILILNSCSINEQKLISKEPEFVIEEEEFILKIEILDAFNEKYTFVLTPENVLLSQYNEFRYNEGDFEQCKTELTSWQISMVEHYLKQTKKDIDKRDCNGGSACFSDYFYEIMHINNKIIMFDYGASESTSANLLTEIIIGCSNLRKLNSVFSDLNPISYAYRQNAQMLAAFDTE